MTEKDNDFSYKNFFIKYGFFLAIITVLFGIVFYSVFFARKPWQKYLKHQVEVVLEEYEPNSWSVEKFKRIDNPFCMNAACYEARYIKTGDVYTAMILRIQTFYGPTSAVFTIDKNNNVEFIGYPSIHGRIETQLLSSQSDKRLDYWKKRIPEIIKPRGGKNEK